MAAGSPPSGPAPTSNALTDGAVLPRLIRLAVPNTMSNFLMITPLLVEAWRIAELGGPELAGVAMVFPLFMLLTMWSAGSVGGAVSGAIARAVGAGDAAKAESVMRSGLVIGGAGGLVMAALFFVSGRWLFATLGGSGEAVDIAWAYARVLFAFNVVIWLFNILIGVMRGAGDMVTPLIAIAVISALHFLGSGLFIIGMNGVGGWGVSGAAALLVAAYGAGLVVVLFLLRTQRARVRLRPGAIDWGLTGQIVKPGLFAASQSLTTIVTSLVLTGFAARFGPDILAGYGIGARIELLMIPLIFGVGGAAIALGGAATGAGLHRRAVRVGWTTAATAAVVVGAIGFLLAGFTAIWAPAFSANPTISATFTSYIERVGPFFGFFAAGLALFFASQGMRTLLFPVLGTVVRLLVVLVGGFVVFSRENPRVDDLFIVVAIAMASYGIFIATSLWLGPWRATRQPTSSPAR